jgi:hypothetical protein
MATMPRTTTKKQMEDLAATIHAAKQQQVAAMRTVLEDGIRAQRIANRDRRVSTSAESHVERHRQLAGHKRSELEFDAPTQLERDIESTPGLFEKSLRTLSAAEEHIVRGYWRIGSGPDSEYPALRAVSTDGDMCVQVQSELARAGYSIFDLLAHAFHRVGIKHPELFGKLTRAEEARQIEQANRDVNDTLELLREFPDPLLDLAGEFGVVVQRGTDVARATLDAAVAAR